MFSSWYLKDSNLTYFLRVFLIITKSYKKRKHLRHNIQNRIFIYTIIQNITMVDLKCSLNAFITVCIDCTIFKENI